MNSKNIMLLLACTMTASIAYAQVCRETDTTVSSSNSSPSYNCDMTYRDTVVTCDMSGTTLGTRPSCPPKPMPMMETPKKSYISNYSPYLFAFARDPKDQTLPYNGDLYRGTPGDQFTGMFGGGVNSTLSGTDTSTKKSLAACVQQIVPPTLPTDPKDQAKLVRLQLDNCANQYILRTAVYPFQKSNARLLSMEDPADPSKPVSPATECQPLRMFKDSENEYSASEYLQAAWIKVLQDPTYEKSKNNDLLSIGLGVYSNLNALSNTLTGSLSNMGSVFNNLISSLGNIPSALESIGSGLGAGLQGSIANLSNQATSLPTQLQALAAKATTQQAQQLMAMADIATNMQTSVVSLSVDTNALQNGLTGMASRAVALQSQATVLYTGASGLSSISTTNPVKAYKQLKTLQSQLSNLTGSVSVLQNQMTGVLTNANAIKVNTSALTNQISALNAMQAKLASMANGPGSPQLNLSGVTSQLSGMQSSLTGVSGQVTNLTSQLSGPVTSSINNALGTMSLNNLGNAIRINVSVNEPKYPAGITSLKNPISPPSPFPDVTLDNLSASPYEEINDPTHPFSPRWDYLINDRDYSPLTKLYTTGTTKQQDNTVYCAGVRDASNESNATKQDDLEVKVDVLEFRRKKFTNGLMKRTLYNDACYMDSGNNQVAIMVVPVVGIPTPAFTQMVATSYCFQVIAPPIPAVLPYYQGYEGIAERQPCWKCFGLNGKVDDEQQHPPCTTRYDGHDLPLASPNIPAALNGFNRLAACTPIPPFYRDPKNDMEVLCSDLRKPYTPLNKLKMRYHNPNDPDDADLKNVVLKGGVPEGLTFKEYFGNHMPYPRLWDTGTSIQKSASTNGKYQPPMDASGQYTAIVGVGREAAADTATSDAVKKHPDERCLMGGWGGNTSISGMGSITTPDPISSWTELKLYQTNTLRLANVSCLGRYEKVFKTGGSENMQLLAAGGEWSRMMVSKCPVANPANCTYMTYKEYTEAGTPKGDTNTRYSVQLLPNGWPLAWRGYLASPTAANKFPKFGGAGSGIVTGMDNAQLGDIVMITNGGSLSNPGLAKLGLVVEVNLPDEIKVMEADNGKFPDSCGTTDTWGTMKTRSLFRPGSLPSNTKKELDRIGWTTSCEDTKLLQCEFQTWSGASLYRVRNDVRNGCDHEKSADCTGTN